MVDPSRVRSKLAMLDRLRAELARLAGLDEGVYDADHAWEGRYLVQAAAQVCIDLANHLIASEGWEPAAEFRRSFERLGEHGVLDAALVERLQALTGLRNRLVHLYDDVDDRRVHAAVREGLPDLDAFASDYARFVTD